MLLTWCSKFIFSGALFLANDDTNQKKDPNSTYTLRLRFEEAVFEPIIE